SFVISSARARPAETRRTSAPKEETSFIPCARYCNAGSQTPYFSVNQGILCSQILFQPMRRICLILLVSAFAAPVAALAADRTGGEGSLVFSDANGTIIVQGKGLIFGHFDQGALMVLDY